MHIYLLETKTWQQAFQPPEIRLPSPLLRLDDPLECPEYLLDVNPALSGIHIHTTNMAFEIYFGSLLVSISGFVYGQRFVIWYFPRMVTRQRQINDHHA